MLKTFELQIAMPPLAYYDDAKTVAAFCRARFPARQFVAYTDVDALFAAAKNGAEVIIPADNAAIFGVAFWHADLFIIKRLANFWLIAAAPPPPLTCSSPSQFACAVGFKIADGENYRATLIDIFPANAIIDFVCYDNLAGVCRLDFYGHLNNPQVQRQLSTLENQTTDYRFFGNYQIEE